MARKDKLLNGVILGALFGVLIASSNISWIASVVDSILDILPSTWQTTQYVDYMVFGILGAVVGLIIDKY